MVLGCLSRCAYYGARHTLIPLQFKGTAVASRLPVSVAVTKPVPRRVYIIHDSDSCAIPRLDSSRYNTGRLSATVTNLLDCILRESFSALGFKDADENALWSWSYVMSNQSTTPQDFVLSHFQSRKIFVVDSGIV